MDTFNQSDALKIDVGGELIQLLSQNRNNIGQEKDVIQSLESSPEDFDNILSQVDIIETDVAERLSQQRAEEKATIINNFSSQRSLIKNIYRTTENRRIAAAIE